MTEPRVLVALPQSLLDPASGAARTLRTIAEILARSGFEVCALTTSTSEGAEPPALATTLRAIAVQDLAQIRHACHAAAQWRFTFRGVRHIVLDYGPARRGQWQREQEMHFDRLFDQTMTNFGPQVLLTYGGRDGDQRRMLRARQHGCRLAFTLFNTGYLSADFLRAADLVLTPSVYLARRYEAALNLRSIPLPTPLNLADVLAPSRRPEYVTMINPTIGKGLMFVASLAEEIGLRHPGMKLRVIPARGSARLLTLAGLAGGFDLRRHANVTLGTVTPYPRDFYATARLLLVPSVAAEASARIVAEAQVNAVPPVTSDRGGLPENVADGGFTLPLPPELTELTRRPVGPQAVRPWLELITSLLHDQQSYRAASDRAAAAGARFHPDRVGPRYAEVFTDLAR